MYMKGVEGVEWREKGNSRFKLKYVHGDGDAGFDYAAIRTLIFCKTGLALSIGELSRR